ncbi:hypothetical protein QYF36_015623 [Acer negundo]|nr:hypothetical protein QYF36_015623 [Acer negundo]
MSSNMSKIWKTECSVLLLCFQSRFSDNLDIWRRRIRRIYIHLLEFLRTTSGVKTQKKHLLPKIPNRNRTRKPLLAGMDLLSY